MKPLIYTAVALLAFSTTTSVVAEDETEKSEPSRLEKALAKYERTGEMQRCLNHTQIRHTRVVDDEHIIFEVSPRRYYLNSLPRKCHSLGFHEAIKYTVRGGSICAREMFHVLDGSSIPGPMCSFGEFEKLTKKKPEEEAPKD